MTALKITEDILLEELLNIVPESKNVLYEYNYSKIEELEIEDVINDKLTLRGFLKLMDVAEEETGRIIKQIQELYNRRLEET